MTKKELVEELSLSNDMESKAAASRTVEMIIDIIKSKVAEGENVDLSGLGKFYSTVREGKAPGTGEPYKSTIPKFRAAAAFKSAVRGK